MNEPTHLDLFSGIGGFALAAQWAGFRTIGFCEIDKYCQKVLAKNFLADAEQSGISGRDQRGLDSNGSQTQEQQNGARVANESGNRSEIRITPDIFDLNGRDFAGVCLITGGFPCQPFSVAGKRGGAADDRAIWPEMFRVISEARPGWVLGENVPGIIPMELDNVLSDLEGIGYTTRSFVIPACAVDARHRRDRVWIVGRRIHADTADNGSNRNDSTGGNARSKSEDREQQRSGRDGGTSGLCGDIPDTYRARLQERPRKCTTGVQRTNSSDRESGVIWLPEPDVGRVVARLSPRLDGSRLSEGTNEIVRSLREGINTEAIQWPIRGLGRIQTKEILLAELCEYTGSPKPLGNVSLSSKEASQVIVRGVWFNGVSSCPSCRRRSEKQRSSEHPDVVRLLSQLLTCDCRSTWLDSTGTPTQDRVNRLKGLGNAIVPQVAYEILREIRKTFP